MSDIGENGPQVDHQRGSRTGWLWRFVALFLGVPPIAVYGAEDDVERERSADSRD